MRHMAISSSSLAHRCCFLAPVRSNTLSQPHSLAHLTSSHAELPWALTARGRYVTAIDFECNSDRSTSSVVTPATANHQQAARIKAKHKQWDALAIVQEQLESYNARDIDRFMALMAPDVCVTDAKGQVLASSAEQLRPRYVERFKTPVQCELLGRLVLGNVIVDREIITGLPDGGMADCLATYTVEEGRISRIQFVWQPRVQGTRM